MLDLDTRVRSIRRVTIDSSLAVFIDSTVGPWRFARIAPPRSLAELNGASPRENADRSTLYYGNPRFHGLDCRAGDHIEVRYGDTFEVVTKARPLREGLDIGGFTAEVLPLSVLYPLVCTIQEQGGAEVAADVPLAVFQETDSTAREHGDYHDLIGEIPIEYEADLRESNRQLSVGAKTYKVTSVLDRTDAPHIRLGLRRG